MSNTVTISLSTMLQAQVANYDEKHKSTTRSQFIIYPYSVSRRCYGNVISTPAGTLVRTTLNTACVT